MRSASLGESLAEVVSRALELQRDVRIDLASVEIMTPSFANAFLMTLLDRFPIAMLQSRCVFLNRQQSVIEVMNRAVQRFQSGVRLSAARIA